MTTIETLGRAQYINLETYRKDGSGVCTPVWVALSDGHLVIFTNGNAYKVKRIARNQTCRVAKCGVRGALKGPWYEGQATLVEDPTRERMILGALRKKYGWQMRMLEVGGRVSGRSKNWTYISVALKA